MSQTIANPMFQTAQKTMAPQMAVSQAAPKMMAPQMDQRVAQSTDYQVPSQLAQMAKEPVATKSTIKILRTNGTILEQPAPEIKKGGKRTKKGKKGKKGKGKKPKRMTRK